MHLSLRLAALLVFIVGLVLAPRPFGLWPIDGEAEAQVRVQQDDDDDDSDDDSVRALSS